MSAATSEESGRASLEVGAIVAERYRILGLIGTGGMGAVYRAEHVHMRKTVALKLLHPELLAVEEVRQRFEREAVAAGRIEHPNVVSATDFGKLPDGSFYLVLEFIDGMSLRALLEQGALPAARAIKIAHQTTLALGAAHAAGIVHRDLKPDNVMLIAEPDGGDRVKVLDFGIARVTSPDARRDNTQLTRVGVVMGTVAYMSPEQATGSEVDARADLYSLGVMLYEMIAGAVPFDAPLPSQVLARQLVEEPPPLPDGTPEALSELVFDLMKKKPDERPASAQVVLARLTALTPTPSGRVPPPPSKGLPRPALYAAGGGLVLVAILAFAFGGKDSEQAAASAEPAASAAPVASEAPAAKAAPAPSAEPVVVPEPSSKAALTESPEPISDAAKSGKASSKTGAKGAKAKPTATPTPSPAPKPAPAPKRKTGPGGIYIPPPDQWFK